MNKRKRKKYLKQHGLYVNPKETWNLDQVIARYVRPRLELFKKLKNGYPGMGDMDTPEKWDEALNKMIRAFVYLEKDDLYSYTHFEFDKLQCINDEIQEGLELFAKWYRDLLW